MKLNKEFSGPKSLPGLWPGMRCGGLCQPMAQTFLHYGMIASNLHAYLLLNSMNLTKAELPLTQSAK